MDENVDDELNEKEVHRKHLRAILAGKNY